MIIESDALNAGCGAHLSEQEASGQGRRRKQAAFQLQGDAGCFSGPANLHEGSEGASCQTNGQQHNNDVLHQSNGGYSFPADEAAYIQNAELELGKADYVVSRTSVGQVESNSTPGIQDEERQLRVEVDTIGVQAIDGTDGSISDIFACVTADKPVRDIHMSWKPDPGAVAVDATIESHETSHHLL